MNEFEKSRYTLERTLLPGMFLSQKANMLNSILDKEGKFFTDAMAVYLGVTSADYRADGFKVYLQRAKSENKLLYKGADFIAFKRIQFELRKQLEGQVIKVAEKLHEIGYRGVKGIQNGNFNDEGVDHTNYPHSLDEIKLFIIKSLEESGNKDKIEEVNKFTDYKKASRFLYGNKIKFRTSIEDCRNNETVKVFKNKKSLVKELSYHVRRCKKTVV